MGEHDGRGEGSPRIIGPWRKATASDPVNCIELAPTTDGVALRDTKDEGRGPTLHFTQAELGAFLQGAKSGEFDDLAGPL